MTAPNRNFKKNLLMARQAMIKERVHPSMKKGRRYHPGTLALREIKTQQKSVGLLIPKRPFKRTVREFFQDYKSGLRIAGDSLEVALQEVSESLITKLVSDAQMCSIHAGRIMVTKKDMQLARSILQKRNYRS